MQGPSTTVRGLLALCGLALSLAMGAPGQAAESTRSFTPAQLAALQDDLSRFGPLRADIFVFGDTREMKAFGDKLAAILTKAGWKPKIWPLDNGIAYGVVGVPVFSKASAGQKPDEAAQALATDLRADKIAAKKLTPFKDDDTALKERFETTWNDADVGDVRIFVGLNPN